MKKIKNHFPRRNIKNLTLNKARNRAKKRILFIEKHMHDPLFRKFLKEEKMNYKKRGQRKSFFRMLMIATVTKRRWLDALEKRRKK